MLIPIPGAVFFCDCALLCCAVCLPHARFLYPALLIPSQTQNLARAHMYMWVPVPSDVDVANKTSDLFREFSDYVTVRRYVVCLVKRAGWVSTRMHSPKPGPGIGAAAVQQCVLVKTGAVSVCSRPVGGVGWLGGICFGPAHALVLTPVLFLLSSPVQV